MYNEVLCTVQKYKMLCETIKNNSGLYDEKNLCEMVRSQAVDSILVSNGYDVAEVVRSCLVNLELQLLVESDENGVYHWNGDEDE